MNSHYNIQYNDRGKLIYFEVNMKELFNVDLTTDSVASALNHAFNVSKTAVPVKTGLMLRSYTMSRISSTTVRCYFDPDKILGKKRLGKIVKEYYPQYLVDTPKRFDWLQIVIRRFYNALKIEMKSLAKKNSKIDMTNFNILLALLIAQQEEMIKEEKKRRKLEEKRKKELESKKEAFLQSFNTRRK